VSAVRLLQVFAVVEKNPNSVASDGAILPMPYLVLAWIAIIGCPVTSCICYCWYRYAASVSGSRVATPCTHMTPSPNPCYAVPYTE